MAEKKKSNGGIWAGIPAKERGRVRTLMKALSSVGSVRPQDVYLGLVQDDAADEKRKQDQVAEMEAFRTKYATKKINESLIRLADVRDLLGLIANGEEGGMSSEALGGFARAALTEAARELEQACFDLHVYEPGGDSGWFVEVFARKKRKPQGRANG